MSPANENRRDDKTANPIDQARNFVHETVETDKEREQIERGKKSALERATEKVKEEDPTDTVASAARRIDVSPKENAKHQNEEEDDKNVINDAKETTMKGIENAREAISDATRSKEEEKLISKAKKTIPQKAADEAQANVETVKSKVASATEDAKEKASTLKEETQKEWEKTKDTFENSISRSDEPAKPNEEEEKDFLDKAKEKAASLFDDDKSGKDNASIDKDEQTQENPISETTMRDGMVKLGETVQEKASQAVKDFRGKFNSRIEEDSQEKPKDDLLQVKGSTEKHPSQETLISNNNNEL